MTASATWLAVATVGCAALALTAFRLDRRRGIDALSFVPWDWVLIVAVIGTLLAGVRWLRLWLQS